MSSSPPSRKDVRRAEKSRRAARRGRGAANLAYAPIVIVGVIAAVAFSGKLPDLGRTSPVSAAEVVVKDSMSRSVKGGWGVADVGGGYTLSLPAAASVSHGAAELRLNTPGGSVSAVLAQTRTLDAVTRTVLSVPTLPNSGGGVYASLLIRRQTNRDSYRAKVQILPSGESRLTFARQVNGVETTVGPSVTLPGHLKSGQKLTLEAQAVGTSPVVLHSRAWIGGGNGPAWNLSSQDTSPQAIDAAGSVGLMAYLSSGSRPSTVAFDSLGSASQPATTVPDPKPTTTRPTPSPSSTPIPSQSPTPGATSSTKPSTTPSTPGTTPSTPATTPSTPATTPTPTPTATDPGPGTDPSPGGGTGAGRAAANAGSAAVGTTNYPVPANAVVVSPNGSDSAAGTLGAPVRSIARAISIAASGQTVVVRAGSYHESLTIPANKQLTLQSYPKEAVWLDGSTSLGDWKSSGKTWVRDGWNTQFDSTPCFTASACSTADAFVFVGSDYPMAAHPDQVWVDGTSLQQVAQPGQVGPGTFAVDYGAQRLTIGTDPGGKDVRAGDLAEALSIRSSGSVVRGIGVRRYGTPLPKIAAVKADATNVTVENMVITNNATTGISFTKANDTARNITANNNGMLGILANYADGLKVLDSRADRNNVEHFRAAPVAGGIKITRSRGIQVADSHFGNNYATGVWFDESVYDIDLVSNDIVDNGNHGASLELSAKAVVADNLISGNAGVGLKVNDTNQVQIWNNTFVGSNRTIWIVQDARIASNLSNAGHDPRQPLPDPTMTWLTGDVTQANNIFSYPGDASPCVLCVDDATHKRSAETMKVTSNGNLYNRSSAASSRQLITWSTGAGNPKVFSSVAAFRAATGQDAGSSEVNGSPYVSTTGGVVTQPQAKVAAAADAPAGVAVQPLPKDVADATDRPVGARKLGIWTD